MCGIVGFVASIVSFAVAVFTAQPLANALHKWFNFSTILEGIMDGLGRPLNILICFIGMFIFCRLLFWVLMKLIKKVKEQNKTIDMIDKVLGLVLGACKLTLIICTVFIVVTLLEKIPLVGQLLDPEGFLMKGSYIGSFLYHHVFIAYIWPYLGDLLASTIQEMFAVLHF